MNSSDRTSADGIAAGLGHLLGPLRRAVLRTTRRKEALPDLPEAQIELLRVLSTAEAGLAPRDVAAQLKVAPSTVSNLVRAMAQSGLVRRVPQPDDLRAVVLTASPEALVLLERYDKASTSALAQVVAQLSSTDRAALSAALPILERLVVELEQQDRG